MQAARIPILQPAMVDGGLAGTAGVEKTKGVDAPRKTRDSPLVVCMVARVLWADRVIERARYWFGRVTPMDPDLGDVWAWWLKFERQGCCECEQVNEDSFGDGG